MEIKLSNQSLCYTFNKMIHLFSKCASPCSVIAFTTPHICCLPAPELNINALSPFFFPSHHIPHNLIIMTNATPQLKAELGDGLRRISIAGNCLRGGAGASVCFPRWCRASQHCYFELRANASTLLLPTDFKDIWTSALCADLTRHEHRDYSWPRINTEINK